MEMKQIASIVNGVTGEILGNTELMAEDLSNVVDVGTQLFNATSYDVVSKTLVDHIGRVVFVNRLYPGNTPSVLMDSWEYGAVLEKIATDLPEASVNETWELENDRSYDQDVFSGPRFITKFFNKRVTFEVAKSITNKQLQSAFSSAEQLNSLISMVFTSIENSITIKMDALIMRTINNMIVENVEAIGGVDNITGNSFNTVVNLLHLYKSKFPTATITAENALQDMEFLKFASYVMGEYQSRLSKMSVMFNVGNQPRFTPREDLHVVLLSSFKNAANYYLQSTVFNNTYTALPNSEEVPYWQGPGVDYGFASVSEIHAIPSSRGPEGDNTPIELSGVLGVMFDRNALGVANLERRVTTHYNARAEFTNYFYKQEAGYFNDLNENFVVFVVVD